MSNLHFIPKNLEDGFFVEYRISEMFFFFILKDGFIKDLKRIKWRILKNDQTS